MWRGGRSWARSLALAVAIAGFATAPSAAAATRYAAPFASGTCAQDDPCGITTAVESAGNGDEVVVAPGSYDGSNGVSPHGVDLNHLNLDIHGEPGRPRPVISFGDAGEPTVEVLSTGAGSAIRDVRIDATGGAQALFDDGGATLERVQ